MILEKVNDSLCKALYCKPDDLAANHSGRLGPSQKFRLLKMAVARAGGIVLCGVVLLVSGIPAMRRIDFWSVFFVLVFGGLLVAIAVMLGGRVVNMSLDAIEDNVEQVEGEVTTRVQRLTQGRGGQRTYYFLEFPALSRTFAIDYSLYKAVTKGDYYRAYYAPHSNVIVGMEKVPSRS